MNLAGHGFIVPTNPCLSVTFEGEEWWLQLSQPESEGAYEAFRAWHEQVVTPAVVRTYVPRAHGLEWRDLRSPPGMPQACEARFGSVLIHLNGKSAGVSTETMRTRFLEFMGPDPGGKRLNTL